jgi:hypothetical protein
MLGVMLQTVICVLGWTVDDSVCLLFEDSVSFLRPNGNHIYHML